jgi:sterol desaturase/sphingolipid hydroxylase (fatty acid hydroxylase superfamily)
MNLFAEIDSDPAQASSDSDKIAHVVLRRAAYPVLLAAVVLVVVATLRLDWNRGLVSFCFVVGVLGYLAALERLIPYQRGWHPDRREWGWYGIYFLLTMLGGGLALLLVTTVVTVVARADPALPLGTEIPLAVLLGSLISYLVHRLGHSNRWLWRFHGIHHVPEKVNVGNNGVNHVLDIVLAQGAVQLTLALLGFSSEAVFAVGAFVTAQGYFVHANIEVRVGWLNYVVSSPEQHRMHHSVDLAEAGHYGSDLSVWDRLFGTFTWRPGRAPVAVGLANPDTFPRTGAVVASLIHPWRRPVRSVGRAL